MFNFKFSSLLSESGKFIFPLSLSARIHRHIEQILEMITHKKNFFAPNDRYDRSEFKFQVFGHKMSREFPFSDFSSELSRKFREKGFDKTKF